MVMMMINNMVWSQAKSYDRLHYVLICAVLMCTPTLNADQMTTVMTFRYCQITTILLLIFVTMAVVHRMPWTVCSLQIIFFGRKLFSDLDYMHCMNPSQPVSVFLLTQLVHNILPYVGIIVFFWIGFVPNKRSNTTDVTTEMTTDHLQ